MRISWMILCLFVVVVFNSAYVRAQSLEKIPNVLLIVSDDQGWGDIGYYNDEMRTPNLDRLASEGVRLDSHYVQPQCTPTRVALMTGRYPSRFGLHACQASNDPAFPKGTLTLASMLKQKGYATGMSGKWHMGSNFNHGPNHFGFDYSHGAMAGATGMYDHRYRLGTPYENTWHRNLKPLHEVGHATDLTCDETIKWIREHKDKGPWFFYVPFQAPHTPLVVGDPKWLKMNDHIDHIDRRLFASVVSHMDDAIGAMVKALDETGQRDNTLIIFMSDNGPERDYKGGNYPPPDPAVTKFSSSGHLRGMKKDLYEGGIRVPTFVNWKGKLKPSVIDTPMHVVDWMPTLANLMGFESRRNFGWDGMDVWSVITGEQTPTEPRTIYWVWGAKRQREALRHGDWKILRNSGNKWELYNLADDPTEKNDLRRKQPDKFDELYKLYELQRKSDAE